jgi:hypothetical protein
VARAFTWLPGRGRIAWVDGSAGTTGAFGVPGSVFTMAPDGSSRELLVSAGRFAPAATVTLLSASPDGQKLAFTIALPDARGEPEFQSLWVLQLDSAEFSQAPVTAGYRVTDLWWLTTGLAWQAVDGSARAGDERFQIGLFDPASATTSIIFQSALVEDES